MRDKWSSWRVVVGLALTASISCVSAKAADGRLGASSTGIANLSITILPRPVSPTRAAIVQSGSSLMRQILLDGNGEGRFCVVDAEDTVVTLAGTGPNGAFTTKGVKTGGKFRVTLPDRDGRELRAHMPLPRPASLEGCQRGSRPVHIDSGEAREGVGELLVWLRRL